MTSNSVQSPPRLGQRFLLIEIQHVLQCTARSGAITFAHCAVDVVNFSEISARLMCWPEALAIMRKFISILAMAVTAVSAMAVTPTYVDREVLVKFKTTAVTLPPGAVVKKYWQKIGWRLIKLPASLTTAQGLTWFHAKSNVQTVEVNAIKHWTRTVNDPMFGQQYALPKIKANQAWD